VVPVVAGALTPDCQAMIKMWKTKMTPCTTGSVNNTETMVLRDTGSTTCVLRSSLVKPEQMTGSYELCMLIDGVVKRYSTAVVELDTPYYRGTTKLLCMETAVQDIIIGNIPGTRGTDVTFDTEHNHDLKRVCDTLIDDVKVTQEVTSEQNNSETECSETDGVHP